MGVLKLHRVNQALVHELDRCDVDTGARGLDLMLNYVLNDISAFLWISAASILGVVLFVLLAFLAEAADASRVADRRVRGRRCGDADHGVVIANAARRVSVMRTLTILTFAAFIAVPTFVAAQSMTTQQYHKEKGPCACPEDKDEAGNKCGRRSAFCESDGKIENCYLKDVDREKKKECWVLFDGLLRPRR
jgi:hypothetical protein